jgi:hypothetical protein
MILAQRALRRRAVILAYFGPETILPVASVIATVFGAMMMFGRSIWNLALVSLRWVVNRGRLSPAEPLLKGPIAWRRGKQETAAETTPAQRSTVEEA